MLEHTKEDLIHLVYRLDVDKPVLGWGDVQFLAEEVSIDHSFPSANVATC